MALDALLGAVAADGRAEVDAVVRRARRDAATRVEAARAEAADIGRGCEEPDLATEREARRRRSAGVTDAVRIEREALERAWQSVRGEIMTCLGRLRHDPLYPAAFQRLVAEAAAAVATPGRVAVHRADVPLAESVCPELTIEGDLDTAGGVVVIDLTGRVRSRNTVEDRLAAVEPELRRRFHAALERNKDGTDDAPA